MSGSRITLPGVVGTCVSVAMMGKRGESKAAKTKAEIQAGEGRAPLLIGGAERSEGKPPFAIGSYRLAPLIDAVIVVSRLAELDRAAVVRVPARDPSGLVDNRRRFDFRKLLDPDAGVRIVSEVARKRAPIDRACNRLKGRINQNEPYQRGGPTRHETAARALSICRKCQRRNRLGPLSFHGSKIVHCLGAASFSRIFEVEKVAESAVQSLQSLETASLSIERLGVDSWRNLLSVWQMVSGWHD